MTDRDEQPVARDPDQGTRHPAPAEPGTEDTEGHGSRLPGPEVRADDQEAPRDPGDPDDGFRGWSDRNMKRELVPVRW